jgi:aryl-alcohol dehydrogenase-like predicted oxidoreductase
MDKNKIALGTAQFGMDYGINNKKGKISKGEVFEILNESLQCNIDVLDTAYVYKESESLIGQFIGENKKTGFKVISKLPECDPQEVRGIFDSSVKRLSVDTLYGYMIHNFQHYMQNPEVWRILKELKSEGKIKKIGMSLYFLHELEHILKNRVDIDIIQVPYSIFDQRFERYFSELKNNGVEIHVRSVFLQGLVFKDPSELDGYFAKIKKKIADLNSLSAKLNIPLVALCLDFAILNRFVDRVVVGVDSMDNLKEIISSPNYLTAVENILPKLYHFREDDENMILPINWKVNTE